MLPMSKRLRTTVLTPQQRQRTAAHQPSMMQNPEELPTPTQFNNPTPRNPVSRGRGHQGGGQGPPHLPYCLWCCPQGQPSWGLWHNGYPIPPTTRECSYFCPTAHSPGGIPSWTGTCPADPSFLCPSSNKTFTSVQVVTQLTWPGGGSIPTCSYLQHGSWGATTLKAGGNTPP